MRKAIVMGLLILFSLAGCAVGGRPTTITNPLPLCDDDKIQVDCIKSTKNHKVSELTLTQDDRPTLGLTFSGGGSKSSPFVMGVLKRFVDEGWIYKTQYLSSVSGGSYTAFYLYYRAYKAVQAYTHETEAQSVHDYLRPDPAWPGLRRYFVDARANDKNENEPPFISMQSPDYAANPTKSLAAIDGGCKNLTQQPSKDQPPPVWQALKQEVYQGWVECYQDLLMTHQAC
ncbi:hypothetical protein R75461_08450 [Paraburkholderia nemoris]|uniref:hypothetical protein n=1 Tax=Paraburkholderia nemoris TaxID=2793076 RepID=UPI00190BB069|nr:MULTISPECIES: hypothetical protein [Paraburkholderia]MBK3786988.1 hypothetical protein [Paraburkholderia aspalathi]CAE6868771.1 hypothetical protein R75461_08450 [Paraburkholderia nemoris]